MGFFDRFFGKKHPPLPPPADIPAYESPDPDISFGHYVDANKTAYQLDKWEEANTLFGEKKYTDSFIAFLEYAGDPAVKNIAWERQGGEIRFTLEQGSKIIRGLHDGESVTAQALLAEFQQPPIAVMRQLLAANYQLRYTKFAIEDHTFGIYFKSPAAEASPNKLYHSLKELALKADKNDDFLTEEFSGISKTDRGHIVPQDEKIGEIKYAYWLKWSEEALAFAGNYDSHSFTGIISYTLLNLLYKTDYLLSPQGHFLDEITRIQHIYWNKQDARPHTEKNDELVRQLKLLLMKPETYFTGSFYGVKTTFGLAPGTGAQTISDYISDCLKNTDWYIQHKYPEMEMTVYEYTVTYCLFHYGMYPAHYRLFGLHMQILNEAYYRELGFAVPYVKDGAVDAGTVKEEIRRIVETEKAVYPNLTFPLENLKFDTPAEFHYSFLSEMRFLNFVK